MTDTNTNGDEASIAEKLSRRRILASAAGVAAAGAAGVSFAGRASADPSGTFPSTSDDPLELIRADRVRLVGRSSDPASPDNGTVWYRGDL